LLIDQTPSSPAKALELTTRATAIVSMQRIPLVLSMTLPSLAMVSGEANRKCFKI
jgi:hypothetical protein